LVSVFDNDARQEAGLCVILSPKSANLAAIKTKCAMSFPIHELAVNDAAGLTVAAHDKVENVSKLQRACGYVTQFAYDRLNRRTSESDPFGKQLKYEYDFAGNLTRITDRYRPNGRKRDFTYDSLDRVTKET
jgi:YD repeat-containing protein